MTEEQSYTTEEISKLLKISKLTVYDLIKKETSSHTVWVNKCELMQPIWRHINVAPSNFSPQVNVSRPLHQGPSQVMVILRELPYNQLLRLGLRMRILQRVLLMQCLLYHGIWS